MPNHRAKREPNPWGTRTHEQMKATGVTPPKPTEAERKRAREEDARFFGAWAREMREGTRR